MCIVHMLHILYISIFDMLIDCLASMPYNSAAFGDSDKDERSYQELQELPPLAHSPPLYLPQPPAVLSHAGLDKRKDWQSDACGGRA